MGSLSTEVRARHLAAVLWLVAYSDQANLRIRSKPAIHSD